MKTVYRGPVIILWLFALFLSTDLCAQVEVDKQYADSLGHLLSQAQTAKEKVPYLREFANLYWQQPESVYYLKEMINTATVADSMDMTYAAVVGLCRYYYNIGIGDSVMYWREQLDSICKSRSDYPDDLYMAANLVCKNYLEAGNYERAMNEAINQLNHAKEQNQEFGLMKANESLALIYLEIHRDSDAVVAFRDGLVWLNKNEGRTSFKLQYLSEMIMPCLRLNLFEESGKILEQYNGLLDKAVQSFKSRGLDFPVQWHFWWINSFYSEYYSRQDQLDKAKYYLEKASQYADASLDEEMKFPYYWAKIHYNFRIKDYEQALDAVNKALAIETQLDLLKKKVELLRKSGRLREAVAVYDEVLAMRATVSNEAFTRQINQLRTLNDLNDKNKQISELAYQKEQLAVKQNQLIVTIVISVLLIVLLYFLYRFYKHSRRLKNELQCEKDSLVTSEKLLRMAKEEAELANQRKTAFIANISHEIRTPLNAIVGFSELLAEDSFGEKEKQNFANVINTNSELLLNLVNDVLDLSRLESGNARFTMTTVDAIACCKESIEAIDHRLAREVELKFTSSHDSCIIYTDRLRLEQILVNLLTNATKFTKQGGISLHVEKDEMNNSVQFIVTDTGCGIPEANRAKIFEHFEKLDEFMQGTGLGLPICKIIARQLNANLYLDTSYTNGARFIISHPLIDHKSQ